MTDPIARLDSALSDRYRLERKIGQGGMATVYLARDLRHERDVALKVLRPELAAVIGADRFLTEIRTTANLQHPHILPLHDSGEVEGTVFYVMPYVRGDSVRDRLEKEKQLPVLDATRIAAEVASALDYAHRQGIVHRDIKPENILLHDGRALVADFGIALAASRTEGAERLTETGMSLGTPHYMSPEQAMGERDVDARADVYALGCVLYEMLVGEPPFTAPSAQAVVAKLITAEAPEVTEYRKTVPPHVSVVIRTALQKLPADRFASAAEFREALEDPDTATRLGLLAGAAGSPRSPRTGSGRGTSSRLPWAVAAGALVIALVALGASIARGTEGEASRPARFALGLPDASGVRAVPGSYGYIAVSPDGSEIVFQGTQQGQRQLFRRSLDTRVVELLPGTEDAAWPAFSPDGREIAFATPEGVFRLALDGGRPRRVATPPDIPIGISWAPDGTLLFGMLAFNMDYAGITAVSASGGDTLRRLTEPESMDHWPWVLPGGGYALYTDYRVERGGLALLSLEDGSTEVLEVDGSAIPIGDWVVGVAGEVLVYINDEAGLMAAGWDPATRRVTTPPIPVPGLPAGLGVAALAADGTLVMTVGAPAYQIVEVGEDGEVERLLAPDSVSFAAPRYSRDGSTVLVAAALRGDDEEVWTVDLTGGVLSQLAMGFEVATAEWSADDATVFSTAQRQSFFEGNEGRLFQRPSDARSGATMVAQFPRRRIDALHPHPDGIHAAFTVDVGPNPSQPRYDVVVARLDGDTTVTPFATGGADEVAARFSPDGRWMAYASNESGRFQVYARPFPGPGPRVQVSAEGGGQPVWAPDGGRLFYVTDDALVAAELSVGDDRLEVVNRTRLFQAALQGGPGFWTATYDVHPDGGRFVVARGVSVSGGDVVVWTEWIHELRPLLGLDR